MADTLGDVKPNAELGISLQQRFPALRRTVPPIGPSMPSKYSFHSCKCGGRLTFIPHCHMTIGTRLFTSSTPDEKLLRELISLKTDKDVQIASAMTPSIVIHGNEG